MARRSHLALWVGLGGACLALSACGTASAPATGSSTAAVGTSRATPSSAALSGQFCYDASHFMQHLPAGPTTKNATVAQARQNLRQLLRSTVAGFTSLENDAPRELRKPLQTIVSVYRSDEKMVGASGGLAQISESMVKGNASGSAAFQKVLKYISVRCK
jgi:hypothetical protein